MLSTNLDITTVVLSIIVIITPVIFIILFGKRFQRQRQRQEQFKVDRSAYLLGVSPTLQQTKSDIYQEKVDDTNEYIRANNSRDSQNQRASQAWSERQGHVNDVAWSRGRLNELQNQRAAILSHIPPAGTSELTIDKILYSDGMNYMQSGNGQFKFYLDGSGYGILLSHGRNVWRTPIWRRAISKWFMIMQSDGNLVSYDNSGAFWASNTWGRNTDATIIDDSGALYVRARNGTQYKMYDSKTSEYNFYPTVDSGGYDYGNVGGNLVDQLNWCSSQEGCKGFNTNGWVKYYIRPQNRWYEWTNDSNRGMYVKKRNDWPWTCLGGINVPLRKNVGGDVECMSRNHRDCLWGDWNSCNWYVNNVPESMQPLVCGSMHQREHGSSGYDNGNHWCARGRGQL